VTPVATTGELADWSGLGEDELASTARQRWDALVESGEVVMFGQPTNEPILLVDVDASWADRFAELRDRIVTALGPAVVRVEHVGSTAIPGIVAKPVVDVQVTVPDVEDEDAYRPTLESLGWPMRSREPGHRYLRTPSRLYPRIHVHVSQAGSQWERDHLLFRDYLRAHPAVAAAYAERKREFAVRYRDDRLAYTEAKTPFIRSTLARAERWAGERGWTAAEGAAQP
jgi:GrpB-like predicted nucleotidyltransferase (UPF0157 family)